MAWQRDRSENRKRNSDKRRDEFGGGDFAYEAPRAPQREFNRPTVDQTNVTATVKWFNATKGFGFVSPADGSPDAFLHISALERAGHRDIAEGATVVCDLGPGQRGPQVVAVHDVDTTTASPTTRSEAPPRRDSAPVSGDPVDGTVKFFSADKGFGFVALDEGGKDVFVHVKALERSGLRTLTSDQRVRMTISQGQKGPQAETIALI